MADWVAKVSLLDNYKYQGTHPLIFRWWVNCCLIASKHGEFGVLPDLETVAFELHTDEAEAQYILEELEQQKMVECINGDWVITDGFEDCLKQADAKRRHTRKNSLAAARQKGTHTRDEWESLKEFFGNTCLKCGSAQDIQKDHVIPISRGGSDSIENLQPLCGFCNASKRDAIADYRPKLHASEGEAIQ